MSANGTQQDGQELAADLAGNVVLITGANGTLGRLLVEAFAAAGASLALCGREPAALQQMELQLYQRGVTALAVAADIRYEEDVVRMVHRVVQRFGRIDAVINAVAVMGPRALLVDYPSDPWRDVIAINLTGTYLVCREVLPWMSRQGAGSIVNVTSGVAARTEPTWGAYVASQCAVAGLTQMLAAEVKDHGVRVNLVELAGPRGERRGAAKKDDRVAAFLWLAGPAAAGVTGQRINLAEFGRRPVRAN